MGKITEEMIESCCLLGDDVSKGNVSKKEAVEKIVSELGMNKASANSYVSNYIKMLKGDVFHYTMQIYAYDYYLKFINNQYGKDTLKLAVEAYKTHLDTNANFKKSNENTNKKHCAEKYWDIYSKYKSIMDEE